VKRVLLVCAADCREVEECLTRAQCFVVKVDKGTTAVDCARRENLDGTILISTGKEMDLAETALNLADVNPSLDIIIVVASKHAEEEAASADAIAHAIPKAKVLTDTELSDYLSRDADYLGTRR
jgi:hypothetical protein